MHSLFTEDVHDRASRLWDEDTIFPVTKMAVLFCVHNAHVIAEVQSAKSLSRCWNCASGDLRPVTYLVTGSLHS